MEAIHRLRLRVLLSVVVFIATGSTGHAFDTLRTTFVRGHDVQTHLSHKEKFQDPIENVFGAKRLSWKLSKDGYSGPELLDLIRHSDIFYLNAHAGNSSIVQRQVIIVKESEDNPKAYRILSGKLSFIDREDIRGTTGKYDGPRLVILNGCSTTDYTGDAGKYAWRLATGFGIDSDTEGRAYLGWSKEVAGARIDLYMRDFLVNWASADSRSQYPTLAEALKMTGPYTKNRQLTIVGDSSLRYDFMSGFIGNYRIAGKWEFSELKIPKFKWDKDKLGIFVELKTDGTMNVELEFRQAAKSAKQEAAIKRLSRRIFRWFLTGSYQRPELVVRELDPSRQSIKTERRAFVALPAGDDAKNNVLQLSSGRGELKLVRVGR
jgi:hypothetical protein